MLKNLILRQLSLDESRDAQLDQLAPKASAVIAVGEKAVVDDLHRDRAEPLPHAERADVPHEGAHEASPVEPVVVIEAAVFRRDEGLLDVARNVAQLHVDPTYDRKAAD